MLQSGFGDLPAAPKVQLGEMVAPFCKMLQPGVVDLPAAVQVQLGELEAPFRKMLQPGVGDLQQNSATRPLQQQVHQA